MRIVIITNNSGGLYGFRNELITELINLDNYVIALTPFDSNIEDLKEIGVDVIETPIDRRGVNPITDLRLFYLYIKLLKDQRPDLVITYTIKPNIYGGIICRLKKIPYIANITGVGTAFQGNGILRKFVTVMYKVGLKKAKTVFFENSENRRLFIQENIVQEEQTCLLNGAGVNLEHYRLIDYPVDDVTTKFLFIGRVMKEKGIDELFDAMQKLKADGIDCSLEVVGENEEDYKEIIKKYESEGWLHYQGYQPDVRPFIADAHCFVLPSWHEGMANTNLECAASGRPVITSNIHGCLEAVEDGISGYLCERQNSQDLYQKMKTFVGLPYLKRKQMGLAGRKRMERYFDKRQVVSKTLSEIYKEPGE